MKNGQPPYAAWAVAKEVVEKLKNFFEFTGEQLARIASTQVSGMTEHFTRTIHGIAALKLVETEWFASNITLLLLFSVGAKSERPVRPINYLGINFGLPYLL